MSLSLETKEIWLEYFENAEDISKRSALPNLLKEGKFPTKLLILSVYLSGSVKGSFEREIEMTNTMVETVERFDGEATLIEQETNSFREEISGFTSEFFALVEQINALNEKKKKLGEKILGLVGPGTRMRFDTGLTLLTIDMATQNRFDTNRFKKEHEDMYNEYIKTVNVRPYTKVIKES